MLTAYAIRYFDEHLKATDWLFSFVPLVISSGGNSGNQSATLVITALTTGDVRLSDWVQVIRRELIMGVLLGGMLAVVCIPVAMIVEPATMTLASTFVVPITLVLVVICGTLCGSVLPLLFKKLGQDPALMSNPFVAGIIDIVGIVIYVHVAKALLRS
jgi:magnesium transporter